MADHMIIVTGAVTARTDNLQALQAACLAHTRRSRGEPGCVSHEVFVDVENPLRLFFFERWESRAAIDAHFALAESRAFVKALQAAAVAVEGPFVVETA